VPDVVPRRRAWPALIDDPAQEGYTMSAGTFVLPASERPVPGASAGRGDMTQVVDEVARRVRAHLEKDAVLFTIPVSVSARHIHVSREVLDAVYGRGYGLRPVKDLSQPGQYAAEETLTVTGAPGRSISNVRILGPCRAYTQVELAPTDARVLGVPRLVIRESGRLDGAHSVTLTGPAGSVTAAAAIRPTRHVHASPAEARRAGIESNQRVRVRVRGEAGVTLDNVLIRVHERYRLDLHLDTDDANAAGLVGGEVVDVLRG
jgi:putative phosphotransacetylase